MVRVGGTDDAPLTLRSAGKAANRVKREIMARVAPVRSMVESNHRARLRRHLPLLPHPEPDHSGLLDRVRADGVAVTTLDELAIGRTDELRAGLARLVPGLAFQDVGSRNAVRPDRDSLLADTAIWRWGLDERLLDLVENYIGLPVRYRGADVRRELANGAMDGVRQWHRDVEDHRQLKILVWLHDVRPDGGPFEYLPRGRTAEVTRELRYVSAYVGEADMARVVPRTEWRCCPGPAWTAVLADPANIFHRVRPHISRDRYSVTFSYTSHDLLKNHKIAPMTEQQRARLKSGLSFRQLAALPPLGEDR